MPNISDLVSEAWEDLSPAPPKEQPEPPPGGPSLEKAVGDLQEILRVFGNLRDQQGVRSPVVFKWEVVVIAGHPDRTPFFREMRSSADLNGVLSQMQELALSYLKGELDARRSAYENQRRVLESTQHRLEEVEGALRGLGLMEG